MQYHYQGKICETSEEHVLIRGHALAVTDPDHPGRVRYIWPEQVVGYVAHESRAEVHKPAQRHSVTPTEGKPQASTPKAPSGGETTLAAICAEVGADPAAARRLLRKKMPRPEGRWTFSASEAEAVKKLLEGLK